MIEVEDAIVLLQNAIPKQNIALKLPILNSFNCVTAQDIISPINVPNFNKSAMDGYAVFSEDTLDSSIDSPVFLQVIAQIFAGNSVCCTAKHGTAARVMTGAQIPNGYDSVVMQEDTNQNDETVEIYRNISPYTNFCKKGEDMQKGLLLIAKYTRINSHHIGIMAGIGQAHVEVLRPLRVGILATGSELCSVGSPLGNAQIYNNSSYVIASLLNNAGVQLVFMEICPDEPETFCKILKEKIGQIDVLITTGGISVGKKDFLPDALAQLKAERLFHRVNMKPGTPVLASVFCNKPIISLSGNPFAALVNFNLFFWPMLAKFMQNNSFNLRKIKAVLCSGQIKQSGLRRFVRAYKNNDGVHLYTADHSSSVISNLANCNCIVEQPPKTLLKKGDIVDVILFDYL